MDKNSFLKIPNEFVWNKDKGYEGTLLKEIGEKVIHVLMYIDCCQTRIGVCNFNINQMMQIIDMKVDSHKGKSIDQFKHIIKELQNKGIINGLKILNTKGELIELDKAKPCDMMVCNSLNIEYKKNDKGEDTEFFMLKHEDYLKIINSDIKNKVNTLNTYCYIIARMCRRSLDDDINRDGGSAESFYDKEENICKQLDISKSTLDELIQELKNRKLIYVGNIGLVAGNGKVKYANNVYTLDEHNLREALKFSKKWYMDNNYSIKNKSIENNIHKLNGLKGQLKKQKNQGKDTTDINNKIHDIENKLNKGKSKNELIKDIECKVNFYNNNILPLYENEIDVEELYIEDLFENTTFEATVEDCIKALDNLKIEQQNLENRYKKYKNN